MDPAYIPDCRPFSAWTGEVARDSLDGSKRPTIRDAPGAGLVMWAESATGAVELERPYARSASLDGGSLTASCDDALGCCNRRQLQYQSLCMER